MSEYPKIKYHPTHGCCPVMDIEQEIELGDSWQDLPCGPESLAGITYHAALALREPIKKTSKRAKE